MVSILIPCFNSAAFIGETIDSLLKQSYTKWECVIVDDQSSDNSQEIIHQYINKYPGKFRLIHNIGKGACAARNVAFEHSKGDYIQYLDADDLLSPNKLEEQMKLFSQFGDKIVTSCKWGRFTVKKELVKWERQPINKDYDQPINWLTDSWMGKGMAQTAVWLTPRRLIEKAGPWDESLKINQDGEFFCRVFMHAEKIKFVPDCGVYYRSGLADSITQAKKHSHTKAESLLRSYKSYERVLSENDSIFIRKALGNNYLNIIYQFYGIHPHLTREAENSFYRLGLNNMWPFGGNKFKILAKVIGFKNALSIRSLCKIFTSKRDSINA